jgi:hypothetical protein
MSYISSLRSGKRPIDDDKTSENRVKYGYYPKLTKRPLDLTGEIPETILESSLISQRRDANLAVFKRQEDLLHLIGPDEHLIGEVLMQVIGEDPTSLTINGDPFNEVHIMQDLIEKMLLTFECSNLMSGA